jgi:hypothetical protein
MPAPWNTNTQVRTDHLVGIAVLLVILLVLYVESARCRCRYGYGRVNWARASEGFAQENTPAHVVERAQQSNKKLPTTHMGTAQMVEVGQHSDNATIYQSDKMQMDMVEVGKPSASIYVHDKNTASNTPQPIKFSQYK